MTFGDRAMRRDRLIDAYIRGATSREVASKFGMSDGYVREIMRDAGVARSPGRPS